MAFIGGLVAGMTGTIERQHSLLKSIIKLLKVGLSNVNIGRIKDDLSITCSTSPDTVNVSPQDGFLLTGIQLIAGIGEDVYDSCQEPKDYNPEKHSPSRASLDLLASMSIKAVESMATIDVSRINLRPFDQHEDFSTTARAAAYLRDVQFYFARAATSWKVTDLITFLSIVQRGREVTSRP